MLIGGMRLTKQREESEKETGERRTEGKGKR